MDEIAKLPRGIMDTLMATYTLAGNSLKTVEAKIQGCDKETIQYGDTERQSLDLYLPSESARSSPDAKLPILFFAYGGGFVVGAKTIDFSPLHYGNVGVYFAQQGIICAIVDYRLVSHGVTYPGGAQDLADAMKWMKENGAKYGADISKMALIGNSAGGIHACHLLFNKDVLAPIKPSLKLVGLLSVSYDDGVPPDFEEAWKTYYGSLENVKNYCPNGLLAAASEEDVKALPPLVNILASLEPEEASFNTEQEKFVKNYRAKGGKIDEMTAVGHNHLSTVLMLLSGQGEDWAKEFADKVKAM